MMLKLGTLKPDIIALKLLPQNYFNSNYTLAKPGRSAGKKQGNPEGERYIVCYLCFVVLIYASACFVLQLVYWKSKNTYCAVNPVGTAWERPSACPSLSWP